MNSTSAVKVESSEKEKPRGKTSEFSEASTFWFPVYEEIFEHAPAIRDAVRLFMWLIARTTREENGAVTFLAAFRSMMDALQESLGSR